MIHQETIDEVRRRSKIEDIVEEYVQLTPRGSSYLGLCPFHAEKTPSFSVNPHRGFFHCFGCGESGNAFTFLMKMQGLTFPESVEMLADRYGIEIKRSHNKVSSKPKVDTRLFYRINELAFRFFKDSLQHSPEGVKQYIAHRGLSPSIVESFGIGFSPPEWRSLTNHLRSLKVPEELILTSGLARRSSRGDLYDTFRGRLIFPVFESATKIVGFGGRIIPSLEPESSTAPKYINSPETPIYNKSKVLYGLPSARSSLREQKQAYLVEGYLDVLSFSQFGVHNVVATCGTSVTRQHIERLGQFSQKVTVVFDGDSAGRAAAGKCFELFMNTGVDADALFLSDGEDPDSFAHSHREGTLTILQKTPRISLLKCFLLSTSEKLGADKISTLGAAAKGELATRVLSVLKEVENPIEQSELLKETAFELHTNFETLSAQLNDSRPSERGNEPLKDQSLSEEPPSLLGGAPMIDSLPGIDRSILRCAMVEKHTLPQKILSDPDLCFGLQHWTLTFVEALRAALETSPSPTISKQRTQNLLDMFGTSWRDFWVDSYQMIEDKEVDLMKTFEECRGVMRLMRLDETLEKLDDIIRDCNDPSEKAELFQEKLVLQRQRESLSTIRT